MDPSTRVGAGIVARRLHVERRPDDHQARGTLGAHELGLGLCAHHPSAHVPLPLPIWQQPHPGLRAGCYRVCAINIFIWAFFWNKYAYSTPDDDPHCTQEEKAYINAGRPPQKEKLHFDRDA